MRRFIIIPLLFISLWITAQNTWYVSPTGSDAAAGTIGAPWATWGKAFNSSSVQAGDTVYFRDGVYYKNITTEPTSYFTYGGAPGGWGYQITRDGTSGNDIHYFAYPGETPILDCSLLTPTLSLNYGIRADATNIHFKGLTLRNVLQGPDTTTVRGWYLDGTNITIENCTVHNCGGIGFAAGTTYNYRYINCDSYKNCDTLPSIRGDDNPHPGNRGVGFVNTNSSDTTCTTYYLNCRAWENGDDGFSCGSAGYQEYDGCWSFMNGAFEGAGNGFKQGWIYPNGLGLRRLFKNNIAAFNRNSGFTTNDNTYVARRMDTYNNIAYRNGYHPEYTTNRYGFIIYNSPGTEAEDLRRVFRNNISYDNQAGEVNASGSYTHSNNSWDISVTVTAADFVSIDSTGITGARQADGSLPDLSGFLELAGTSDLIDVGIDVGLDYSGVAPDLGAFEYTQATPPAAPQISTLAPYGITTVRAYTGGYMINDGGLTITAKGVCWSTDANPDLTDNVEAGGTGSDDFIVTLDGLTPNTTYHVRAYATNSTGTSYGVDESFTTSVSSIVKHAGKIVKR